MNSKISNRLALAGIAGVAALLAGAGVAAASPSPTASPARGAAVGPAQDAGGGQEQPGTEQPQAMGTGGGRDIQDGPGAQGEDSQVRGSLMAPEQPEQTGQQVQVQLQSLARLDQAQAETAALAAAPGSVRSAQLGNENGSVVWDVSVMPPAAAVSR